MLVKGSIRQFFFSWNSFQKLWWNKRESRGALVIVCSWPIKIQVSSKSGIVVMNFRSWRKSSMEYCWNVSWPIYDFMCKEGHFEFMHIIKGIIIFNVWWLSVMIPHTKFADYIWGLFSISNTSRSKFLLDWTSDSKSEEAWVCTDRWCPLGAELEGESWIISKVHRLSAPRIQAIDNIAF